MTAGWDPGERGRAALFAAVVMAGVLYPLRQYRRPSGERVDGFPLSYYPMFSVRRRPRARFVYVVGVRPDGGRRRVHHEMLGSGGLNQVRRQLNRVLAEARVEEFVTDLAARLSNDPDAVDLVRVEVVGGEFDLDECMLQRRFEGVETVLGGADLPGRLPPEVPDRVSVLVSAAARVDVPGGAPPGGMSRRGPDGAPGEGPVRAGVPA